MGVEFYTSIENSTVAVTPCLYSCSGNQPATLVRTGPTVYGVGVGLNALHFNTPYTPVLDEVLFLGVFTNGSDWSSATTTAGAWWSWAAGLLSPAPSATQALPGGAVPHFWPKVSTIKRVALDGVATDATLSKGSLVAVKTSLVNGVGARSSTVDGAGKFYFEATLTNTHGNNDCVGILLSTGTYSQMVVSGTNSTIFVKWSGMIWTNNVSSGFSLGAAVSGDVICIAVDLAARKAWLRKNNGLWNNQTGATPVTGVGGVQIATTGVFGPAVGFGGTGSAINDTLTVNFGAIPYSFAVPAGYGDWTT
jgi:hypothetical protein